MTTYFPSRSPSGLRFLDPHDAVTYWREHAPSTYDGGCETIGDSGAYRHGITVAPLQQKFEFVLVAFSYNLRAEKAFHKVCDAPPEPGMAGWSSILVWDSGQNWYARVDKHHQRTPPEEVANAIADVLESSAHGADCASV